MGLSGAITIIQVFFAIVIGLYFWNLLRTQQGNRVAVEKESRKELDKLQRMRQVSLTEPLSEKTRPASARQLPPAWCWKRRREHLALLLGRTPGSWKWTPLPLALTNAGLPIRLSVPCMTRSIKEQGPWVSRASRSLNPAL